MRKLNRILISKFQIKSTAMSSDQSKESLDEFLKGFKQEHERLLEDIRSNIEKFGGDPNTRRSGLSNMEHMLSYDPHELAKEMRAFRLSKEKERSNEINSTNGEKK